MITTVFRESSFVPAINLGHNLSKGVLPWKVVSWPETGKICKTLIHFMTISYVISLLANLNARRKHTFKRGDAMNTAATLPPLNFSPNRMRSASEHATRLNLTGFKVEEFIDTGHITEARRSALTASYRT